MFASRLRDQANTVGFLALDWLLSLSKTRKYQNLESRENQLLAFSSLIKKGNQVS